MVLRPVAGDGLLCHLPRLLSFARERFATRIRDVVLENCSSGGYRIDLGLARDSAYGVFDTTPIRDASLQLLLAGRCHYARRCLASTRGFCGGALPTIPTDLQFPQSQALTVSQLDYYTRIGIAPVAFSGSHRELADLVPLWVADRYAQRVL
jgi:alpha-galactosidase